MPDFKKDAPMLTIALLIVCISGWYVFQQGKSIDPLYGWKDVFGGMAYPQPLNLNNAQLNGNLTAGNEDKLNNIFYGSNHSSNIPNVCKNFNCKSEGSTLDGITSEKSNSVGTPYCIIPAVKTHLSKDLCPVKGDCTGNCNVLYDTMVKPTINEYSGMKGVDKIFADIENKTPVGTNKNEVIKQQYKNQIKYLLCQMGQQNIYDYEYGKSSVESIYFTWDNLCQMNGWPTCGGESKIALGFYIISFIVAAWISFKILYGMFKINKNKIFESLFFGSMPERISKDEIPNIVQYLLSWPIYWIAFIYFCNSVLLAKLSESKSVEWLTYSIGGGIKLIPFISSLGLWILLPLARWVICEKGPIFIHVLLVVFVSLVVVYYFLIIYNTHIDASYNDKSISDGPENGIQWDKNSHSTPTIPNVKTENTTTLSKIFPYLWMVLAGIPIVIYIIIPSFFSWRKSKSNISNAALAATAKSATAKSAESINNNNNSTVCGKLPFDKKKKGGLLCSTILMISYIAILSTNIFIWFVAPGPFIVLMVLQRLIMTNFIPPDGDGAEDWRSNWDFILFPLLNYVIKNLYGIRDDELSGKSNSNIFKYIGKGNKGTNKKLISSNSRVKIKNDLNNIENGLLRSSTIPDLKKYKNGTASLGSNIGSLGINRSRLEALQKLTGGSGNNTMTNADLHVHIKYLLDLIHYIGSSGALNNDNLKTLQEQLKTLKGRQFNIKRKRQFKKFKKLTQIIDNLINAINIQLS